MTVRERPLGRGAALAVKFALAGVFCACLIGVIRHWFGSPDLALGIVFSAAAALFLLAAAFATTTATSKSCDTTSNSTAVTV